MDSPGWTPTNEDVLTDWCIKKTRNRHSAKDIKTIITLGMWTLWKHRNAIVFDGATPSLGKLITAIERESRSWQQAGLLKDDLEHFLEELSRWVSTSNG